MPFYSLLSAAQALLMHVWGCCCHRAALTLTRERSPSAHSIWEFLHFFFFNYRHWQLLHDFTSFQLKEQFRKITYSKVQKEINTIYMCMLFNGTGNVWSNLLPFTSYPETNLKTLDWHQGGAKCKNSPICFTESPSPPLSVQLYEQAQNCSSAQLPPLYMSMRCLNVSQGLSTLICSFPPSF